MSMRQNSRPCSAVMLSGFAHGTPSAASSDRSVCGSMLSGSLTVEASSRGCARRDLPSTRSPAMTVWAPYGSRRRADSAMLTRRRPDAPDARRRSSRKFVHRLAIDGDDSVAGLQSCARGRAIGLTDPAPPAACGSQNWKPRPRKSSEGSVRRRRSAESGTARGARRANPRSARARAMSRLAVRAHRIQQAEYDVALAG